MKPKLTHAGYRDMFVRLVIIAFFIGHIFPNVPGLLSLVTPLALNPGWSYEQKMRFRWGAYFELADFLLQNTPGDAVVLLGPSRFSNIDLYFLYPRKLYYGDETTLTQHPEIEYVAIEGDYPTFSVDGERLMLDSQRGFYRLRR